MSLFCIAEKLCTTFDLIDQLCVKNDQLAVINTALCDKIEQVVGDPDAPCPDCPEPTELVEQAIAQTEAVKAVTAAVAVKTAAIKQALSREVTKKETAPEVAVR